MLTNLHSSGTS